jgi:hypothetical protein
MSELGLITVWCFVYKHFLQAAAERVEGLRVMTLKLKFIGDQSFGSCLGHDTVAMVLGCHPSPSQRCLGRSL